METPGKQDSTESDGSVFKELARITGKYRKGIDAADSLTWKQRIYNKIIYSGLLFALLILGASMP